MNFGFNKNATFYKHSYWNNNAGVSGSQRDFSSTFRISNVSTHFKAPPVVQFSSQGAQVGRMVCGWKVNDKPCSSPPRINNGRPVIQICGGPELKCEFVPYTEGISINTIRNDISTRLHNVGLGNNIGQNVFANYERPDFMRVTRQPTREFHLAHPPTAKAQEHINAGHKEQEAYFNTPMPFTLPEAEQALDWRNQELNNTIRQRDEVQTQLKENEEWVSGIKRGVRGPRSKAFLRSLRGQIHKLWQVGQVLEWRCQNATTRRDETAQNLEKIRHAIEHNKEAYLNSIRSVERQRFPKDDAIFNEERRRTEAVKQEEKRFSALVKQEQEEYSKASMPATMDEARAAADAGVKHFENCVRERNENEALRNEKKSRLEATRTMLAEEWNAIVEHDLELLEEEVASLRRTVELQDQRIANSYIRAAEFRRQKLLGLHSKADFDTSHVLASEALEQFYQHQENRPVDASAPAEADEEQSSSASMPLLSPIDSGNKPEGEVAPVNKPRNPALAKLAALSSEIAARATRRAERQANRVNEVSNASVAAENESSTSTGIIASVPANHTTTSSALGASALAVAAPGNLTTSGAVTGVSANLGELASAAGRGLTGAANTILSAPAIGVGALLYSSKAGEDSDKVPGRENGVPPALLAKRHNEANAINYSGLGREASSIRETGRDAERYSFREDVVKHTASSQSDTAAGATRQGSQPRANHPSSAPLIQPIIKPKPRFDDKTSIPSINTPVSSKAIGAAGNVIKPPLAAKPVFDSASLKARQLQALKHEKAIVENNLLGAGIGGAVETVATAGAVDHCIPSGSNDDDGFDMGSDFCEGTREQGTLRYGASIPERMESRREESGEDKPNLGKDISKVTDAQKAELGGVGSGTPGGWGPEDENNSRHHKAKQNNGHFERFKKDDLISSANKPINEQGLSAAARAWEKHAGRNGGTFEPFKGNPIQKNQAANQFINEVLNNKHTVKTELGRGGIEYRLPDGR